MIVTQEPAQKKVFNEDIVLAGETIIGAPCVVYSITITADVPVAGVVSLSNSTTYSSGSIVEKIVLTTGTPTVQLRYPRGLILSSGLSAAANNGSINIAATYD